MNAKRKGWRREDQARKRLEKEGYYVTRSGASLGAWDLVGVRSGGVLVKLRPLVRLVQVKSNRYPSRKEIMRLLAFNTYGGLVSREVWIYPDRKPVRIEIL